MARTTILRYAKYAGTRNAVANKTIMHGFRLHKTNGIGVDPKKSKHNLYFLFNHENKVINRITHHQHHVSLVSLIKSIILRKRT